MKCPKHCWHKIKVQHIFQVDLDPGGLNYYFGVRFIEICLKCNKVRNPKEVVNEMPVLQ